MDAQALGRYLRETRESRELTLEDASGTLHIREDILAAFELGNFSMSGSDVQLRGFLRNYARYLGLNDGQIIAYYQASQQVQPRSRRGRRQRRKQDARPDIPIAPRNITDTPPSLPVVTITSMAEQRDLERNRSNRLLRSLFFGITGLILIGAIGFFLTQIFDISDLNALSERFL
ncbi:MAG: helix-turn-helix domain-containing protein, partial [Aggregatilineales bacterium]